MAQKILVIEDDPASARLMKALLAGEGYEALLAAKGAEGLESARQMGPAAVLLDLGLPDMPGMEVLEALAKRHPEIPVLILTADTDVKSAVQAIQKGAYNYYTKPLDSAQLLAALKHALERGALKAEVEDLRRLGAGAASLERLMGPGPSIKQLQDQLRQVASTPFAVLLQGETGAGKEVLARALHEQSPRSAQPFVALDCGAIPENLLESELFGHEKGAFTGADRKKEGHFALAQGGTLFLDEIGNLPLGLQAKLLRVLQEKTLQPLGGAKAVSLDIRLVAASNLDLEKESEAGRFRQDLYYRLAEFRLLVPALRERPEDIPYLSQRFLEEAAVELRKPLQGFAPEALALLKGHAWPGNVRQLKNVVRQAALLAKGVKIEKAEIGRLLKSSGAAPGKGGGSLKEVGEAARDAAEKEAIAGALRQSRGNILRAAKALSIANKNLHAKLKKFGIKAGSFGEGKDA